MKRLVLLLLCLTLTGCSYIGATEDILISSPASLSIIRMETFDPPHNQTPTTDAPASSTGTAPNKTSSAPAVNQLILNTSSKTIHYYDNCSYVARMNEKNRGTASAEMEAALIGQGYKICSWCAKQGT